MSHSGRYSLAVAALVIAATIGMLPIRMMEVTPASLSFATSVVACSCAADVCAADEESAGGLKATWAVSLGTPCLASSDLNLSRSMVFPRVGEIV